MGLSEQLCSTFLSDEMIHYCVQRRRGRTPSKASCYSATQHSIAQHSTALFCLCVGNVKESLPIEPMLLAAVVRLAQLETIRFSVMRVKSARESETTNQILEQINF